MERCDDCGEAFVFSIGLDKHRERCTGSTDNPAAGWGRDEEKIFFVRLSPRYA
jgi:hypothetical protein